MKPFELDFTKYYEKKREDQVLKLLKGIYG